MSVRRTLGLAASIAALGSCGGPSGHVDQVVGEAVVCGRGPTVEGIDVSILMDATPSWLPETKQPAMDRLLQAGVVPMTTAQMVMEWAEVETSPLMKQELIALLTHD